MKRITRIFTAFLLLLNVGLADVDAKVPSVYYEKKEINFDANPIMVDGRTMVPIRALLEPMYAHFEWYEKERKIVIRYSDEPMITLYIGKKIVQRVGQPDIELDVAPMIKEGRTFVPLRFIAEEFNKNVTYDDKTSTVYIEERFKDNIYKDIVNNVTAKIVPKLEFGLCYNLDEKTNAPAYILFVYNEPLSGLAVPATQRIVKYKGYEDFNKDQFIAELSQSKDGEEAFVLESYDKENDIYTGYTSFENMGHHYRYKTYIYIKDVDGSIYISTFEVDESRMSFDDAEIFQCIKSIGPIS